MPAAHRSGGDAMVESLMRTWFLAAVGTVVAAAVVPGVSINGGALSVLLVAAPIGLLGALVHGFQRALAPTGVALALSLGGCVVNASVVLLAGALSSWLAVEGFWPALWAGQAIVVTSATLRWVLDPAAA